MNLYLPFAFIVSFAIPVCAQDKPQTLNDLLTAHDDVAHAFAANPKLDGSEPHWIQDLVSKCWTFDPSPAQGETVSWSGECQDGLASGQGTQSFTRAGKITSTLTGSFAKGTLTGFGKAEFPGISTREGDYIDSLPRGQGKTIFRNGDVYTGSYPGYGHLAFLGGKQCRAAMLQESGKLKIVPLYPCP